MFYKYVLSAFGCLAVGPALPLSPSNHTPIPWLHPHTRHIYTTTEQGIVTHYLQWRHASWEKSATSPNEVKIFTQKHQAEFCHCTNWRELFQECRREVFWARYCSSCTLRSFFPFWKISCSVMLMTPLWWLLCHPQASELQKQSPWSVVWPLGDEIVCK